MSRSRFAVALVVGVGALAAATVTATAGGQADPTGTVWLCRPGQAANPCMASLDATTVTASGSTSIRKARSAPDSKFDCFYVYPTVSQEKTANADLRVHLAEIGTAVAQASRFSQVCRVWAPIYRQRTLASLQSGQGGNAKANAIAYQSLLDAWHDYLAHENGGRPIVFIGHSQGARMLMMVLRDEFDTNPVLRKRLVSAILLGGNITVAAGKNTGGSFEHIPACRSAQQVGCVIAYSSYRSTPPANSAFGRPGRGISHGSDQTKSLQVICVNPAALAGGSGPLDPYFLAFGSSPPGLSISTLWVEYPRLYTAECNSANGATWLQVNDVGLPGDKRPRVTEKLGPSGGLHVDDVSLALGNLVRDLTRQEAAYLRR